MNEIWKDIKEIRQQEVRQQIDKIIGLMFALYSESCKSCKHYKDTSICSCCSRKYDLIEKRQFLYDLRTDTENLIKENEELKKAYEYEKNYKNNLEKEIVNNTQVIEPSALEKIDKLQERCIYYKAQLNLLGKQQDATQRNLNETKKQLAICDKALDKACKDLEKNDKLLSKQLNYEPLDTQEHKDYYIKKAKEESENEKC